MRNSVICLVLLLVISASQAQQIQVEYDKNRDLTIYKTFSFGEGEIITPKDERKGNDDQIHQWVRDAIKHELLTKGLAYLDSLGDLSVSYIIGSLERSDIRTNAAGGIGAGFVMSDYEQSSFVIDMNDRHNFLVWRVNGVTSTDSPNASTMIGDVVAKGFKKFSIKSKKKKK